MTKVSDPSTAFAAQNLQSMDSLQAVFTWLVDRDKHLTLEAREEVKTYFDIVNNFMAEKEMILAQRSLAQLILLRYEAEPRPRRDGTSSFIHEMSQAIYVIWIYNNRERILNSERVGIGRSKQTPLFRTPKQIEKALAIIFNHDSREDYSLSKEAFERFMRGNTLSNSGFTKRISEIIFAFDRINKLEGASEERYAERFGQTELSLGCKMIDTTHNFMSLIGSDRTVSRIRNYVQTKMFGYDINRAMIERKDMLVYLHEYLKAQANLLLLYCDVKEGIRSAREMQNAATAYTNIYYTSSIPSAIHPILGIIRRIMKDNEIVAMLRNTPAPAPAPAAAPSHPPLPDLLRLKRA